MQSLLKTLLELGDATSQNLGFAQSVGDSFSYGEETITETNLLEIRRRHPYEVKLFTFSKHKESRTTGADWEWHIIGKAYTLKMRIQAKRIYKAGGIGNLKQQGQHAEKPQIELLIKDAEANNLYPAYCFYCSEAQRKFWTAGLGGTGAKTTETGCLIADARSVQSLMPTKLADIEYLTIPWHFLCSRNLFTHRRDLYERRLLEEKVPELYRVEIAKTDYVHDRREILPTFSELNSNMSKLDEMRGVFRTEKMEMITENLEGFRKRSIRGLLTIDVREQRIFPLAGTGS